MYTNMLQHSLRLSNIGLTHILRNLRIRWASLNVTEPTIATSAAAIAAISINSSSESDSNKLAIFYNPDQRS